jgi:AcrR family transcriptional regulator
MTQQGLPAAVRPLKERQRAEREVYILEAAEAVLAEKGHHDASMDEIAARVGVAKGTLYLHFPSKDDLVVALFARELSEFRELIEQMATEPSSATSCLKRILLWTYNAHHGQRLQLLFSLSTSISMRWGSSRHGSPCPSILSVARPRSAPSWRPGRLRARSIARCRPVRISQQTS